MNRGRPFEPGNKFGRGRPPGSRNRKAHALQKVLDEYTPALLRKSLAMALQGDVPLLKMFMDRRLPKSSGAPVRIGRLPSATIEQISQSQQNVVDQVAAGNLSPEQAVQMLHCWRRTAEPSRPRNCPEDALSAWKEHRRMILKARPSSWPRTLAWPRNRYWR